MSTTPSQLIDRLNWHDEVYGSLCRLLDQPAKTPDGPPLAVFDFDNTCIFHDIGELFSHYLIDEMLYRYDLEAFWELIDPRDGRAHIRELVERLQALPEDERTASPSYAQYLAEMGAVYARKYMREGTAACYEWAVRLHVGLTPDQLRRRSREAIELEIGRTLEREIRRTTRDEQVRINRGIRVHEEFRQLIGALECAGWEVWVVSATNQWTVETIAELAFGVPASGTLSDQTVEPVLYRQGKVDIIRQEIGRHPALVFGDSQTDFEMLCSATELAVLVDRGLPELRQEALDRGWAVQPQEALTCSSQLGCP